MPRTAAHIREARWRYGIRANSNSKYTDVRKNYPEQSSQVVDSRQVNGVNRGVCLNSQKVRMHRIACEDASTHGKFIFPH